MTADCSWCTAGVFIQFDHVEGVVDIYHQGIWTSASLRSSRLHFSTEDGVQKVHSLRSSFEVVTSDGTVFCGVIHDHHVNGTLQFDRIEPC